MKPVVLLSICLFGLATAQYPAQRRLRANHQGQRIAARRSGPYSRKIARRVQPSFPQEARNARQSQDPFAGFGSFESESSGFDFDGPRFNPQQQVRGQRPRSSSTRQQKKDDRFGISRKADPLGILGTLFRFLSYLDGAQYGRDGNRQRLNKQPNGYESRPSNDEYQRRQDYSQKQQRQDERQQQRQDERQQQRQEERQQQQQQQRERQRQQEEQQERQREREEERQYQEEFNARPVYQSPDKYSPPANKRLDDDLKAIIKDVKEAPLSDEVYKPASGPAYTTKTHIEDLEAAPRFDDIQVSDGPIPAEQRELELAVFAGANAYKPEAVYQTEDRLEFQINGHKGPHSYRYGYDTGHGYNRQFRYEERDGAGYVKGRYGFFDKYGKLQVVNYEAHPEKGFHAEGAHVPHYPH